MAIITSVPQTVRLTSKTTFKVIDPQFYEVEQTATTARASITCAVALPAGATINSAKFKAYIHGATLYGGTTKVDNIVVGSHNFNHESTVPSAATITVQLLFKNGSISGTLSTIYQTRTFENCVLEVDYTPGASNGTLDKSSVPMDGQTPITLSISALNSAYSHKVIWKTGSAEVVQAIAAEITTAIFVPPLAWNNQHPHAVSGTASCRLQTYNGATLIGEKMLSFIVTVPGNIQPSGSLAITPESGFNGLYLKGVSAAKITVSAAGAYGSTIAQINIAGGGFSGAGPVFTTGVLQNAGEVDFTAQVVDTRGRSVKLTGRVTVTNYNKPVLSNIVIFRADASGNENKNGTYIKMQLNYAAHPVPGNSIANATVKYREAGTNTYSPKTNVPNGGNGVVFGGGTISITKSFEVVLEVADAVGQVSTYTDFVRYKTVVFDFRHDRAGIGRVAGNANVLALPDDWHIEGPNLQDAKYIPNGADLNDYRTPGLYYNPYTSETQTMSNKPSDIAFSLMVLRASGVLQLWFDYQNKAVWSRRYYSGDWSPWIKGITASFANDYETDNGKAFAIKTQHGVIHIGVEASGGKANISTANTGFLFNKPMSVTGEIYAGANYNQKVYHTGNIRHGSSAPSGGENGDIYLRYV